MLQYQGTIKLNIVIGIQKLQEVYVNFTKINKKFPWVIQNHLNLDQGF